MASKIQKNNTALFILATITACWFAFTGVFWTYWIALFIAYPFGIVSFCIWKKIKADGRKRNIVIPIVLGVGLLSSLIALVLLAFFG
jgi:hypothetical protein